MKVSFITEVLKKLEYSEFVSCNSVCVGFVASHWYILDFFFIFRCLFLFKIKLVFCLWNLDFKWNLRFSGLFLSLLKSLLSKLCFRQLLIVPTPLDSIIIIITFIPFCLYLHPFTCPFIWFIFIKSKSFLPPKIIF